MKPNVLLVAHDAGGAEILSAWFTKNRGDWNSYITLDGPALRIFNRDHHGMMTLVPFSFMERFGHSDLVLTGSSLEADLERKAIALARKLQIPCATFLDHWDLYRERFGNAEYWLAGLPDEVWVGDNYAYQYALRQGFPAEKLRLVANPYLDSIREKSEANMDGKTKGTEILYICEPISRKLAVTFGKMASQYQDELKLMKDFLDTLSKHRNEFDRVTIRLHPSEQKSKYENILKGYEETLPVCFSNAEHLVDDLFSHTIIVGIESNALAVALHLGKPVYSCITGKPWQISLPHKEICRIDSFHHIFQAKRGKA